MITLAPEPDPPVIPFLAVRIALGEALHTHVPDGIATFEELAAWVAPRAEAVEAIVLGYVQFPNVRALIAEFAAYYCRPHVESSNLVKAANSVLDDIAFAELLIEQIPRAEIRWGLMPHAERPAIRLWLAYVLYRDNHLGLGAEHDLIVFCLGVMDEVHAEMTTLSEGVPA